MAHSPRIRRAGIAALSALALTISPLTVVSPVAGAEESTAAEQANPDATMSVAAHSPTLDGVRAGTPVAAKLSDGHYAVVIDASYSGQFLQILDKDLQPVGEAQDLESALDFATDTFTIVNDDLYYFKRGSSYAEPPTVDALYKAPITSAGIGAPVKIADIVKNDPADDEEDVKVTGIAGSVDGSTIGVVVRHSTGNFLDPVVTADLYTYSTDGGQLSKTALPTPKELYPTAEGTRSEVWTGSPLNPLRGLADGSWLFYSKANVTADADETPVENPPIHITPGDTPTAQLFTGAPELRSGPAKINGFAVSPDGTKIAFWDQGDTTYSSRGAQFFAYSIDGGHLTKIVGGDYGSLEVIQGAAFQGDDIYVYSLNTPSVTRIAADGSVDETLNLSEYQDSDLSTHYATALINVGDDLLAVGGKKDGWRSFLEVALVSVMKKDPINEKYDFRYTFADTTGGRVKPGETAVKKPVFEDTDSFTDLPSPPEKEIKGYAFKDVTRDDVSIDAKTGYVTFTPKDETGIPDGDNEAFVKFPVTVTYIDGTTATASALFTVERAEPKKTDAESWVIDYNNSTAKDVTVGEEVSVMPKADDRTESEWNPTEVPEGTSFDAFPSDSDKALPEGASIAKDGTITYTAPAWAAGKTVTVPVRVTFKDGSVNETSATFNVAEKVEPTTTSVKPPVVEPTTTSVKPSVVEPTTTSVKPSVVEPTTTSVKPTTTAPVPTPIANKYDFHYTFTGGNGGNVTPGSETEGSATKKPAFTNNDNGQEEQTPLKEAQSYEFVNNSRADVTINDKGYVTFTPKNSDDIKDGDDSALVNFPVKVTYTDGSTATSSVTFTVFRPADEIDKDAKPLADIWAIHYGGSLAVDATVGEEATAKPEADDRTDQQWNPGPVPAGTTFAAYPDTDAEHALPEGASVTDDGTVTYTPPASAAGTTVQVPLLVTFEDGSKGETTVFFDVSEAKPTQSVDYALSYGANKATVGQTLTAPVQVLDRNLSPTTTPDGATFALVGEVEGVTINPRTGDLSYTPTAAGSTSGVVRMTFNDGKSYAEGGFYINAQEAITPVPTTPAPVEPTLSSDVLPTHGVATGAVGEAITSPVTILDASLHQTAAPAGARFELVNPDAVKGLSIDPVTGELTFVPEAAGEYNGLVRIYFDNGAKYGESGFSFIVKDATASTPKTPTLETDYVPTYSVGSGHVGEPITQSVSLRDFGLQPTKAPTDAVFVLVDDQAIKGLTIDSKTGELTLVTDTPGEYNGLVRVYYDNGTKYGEAGFSFLVKGAATKPTTVVAPEPTQPTTVSPAPTTTEPTTPVKPTTVESTSVMPTTEKHTLAPTPSDDHEGSAHEGNAMNLQIIIAAVTTVILSILGLLVNQHILNLLPWFPKR